MLTPEKYRISVDKNRLIVFMIVPAIIISAATMDTAIQRAYAQQIQPSVTVGPVSCNGPQGSQLLVGYSFSGFQPGDQLVLQFIDGQNGAILQTQNLGPSPTGSGTGNIVFNSPELNHVYRVRIIDMNNGLEGAMNFASPCPPNITPPPPPRFRNQGQCISAAERDFHEGRISINELGALKEACKNTNFHG